MAKTHTFLEKTLLGVAAVAAVAIVSGSASFASVLVAQEAATPATTPATPAEPVKESDVDNQQRQIKDQNNWLKNYQSELKDIKRQAKTLDTSAVDGPNGLFTQFSNCINQAGVGTQDFWNNIRDCQSMQGDIDAQFNDVLRPARDCANSRSNIDNRRKEKKSNLDRQIKDILRNNKTADVSVLTNIIGQIDTQFGKADALTCTRDTSDALNDIAREFDSLFQDFYNSSNEVNQAANEGRQLKDNQRDYEKDKKKRCEKDKARELKNFGKEVDKSIKAGDSDAQAAYNSVAEIYNQMCVVELSNMKTALDNKDTEAYNEARSTYDELDRTFWDTMNESRQGVQEKRQKVEQLKNVTRDLKRWTGETKRMQAELKKTERLYKRTAKKYANREDRKTELAAFAEYISQAKSLINKIKDGLAAAKEESASDPDAWWLERQDELNELQQEFYEMQQNVQMIGNVIQVLTQAEKDIIKGTARQLKQLKRESNNDPELMNALKDIVNQAKEGLKLAWSQLFSEPEDAMSALEGLDQFGQDWEDTINDWRESRAENEEEEEEF